MPNVLFPVISLGQGIAGKSWSVCFMLWLCNDEATLGVSSPICSLRYNTEIS